MSEWKETELGKLPITWNVKKIGEIGDVTKLAGFEYTSHFKYVDDGEIIALRALNVREGNLDLSDVKRIYRAVSDNLERSKLYKGDILFTYVGANIGQFALVPENGKFHLAPNICRIRCNNGFEPYFLYSYFRTNTFKESLEGFSHGSSQPTMPMGSIRQIPIPIPTPSEQKSISSLLHSLDNKIDLLYRQNATLEKMAETLFRQWFVEEAKEDWDMGKVSDVIKILSGFAFKSSSFVESGKYRLITIKGVQDAYLELNNADNIEELPDRMPDFCKLQIGDILLSLTGNVGRCCLVDTTDLLLNQRVAKLHPINERDRAYTYFLFRQPHIKQLLEGMGKGTAQSNLSPIETSNMELIIPDKEKLVEFSAIATPWLNKLLFNKKSIQTLSQLRASLLPKLMNGEVTLNTN